MEVQITEISRNQAGILEGINQAVIGDPGRWTRAGFVPGTSTAEPSSTSESAPPSAGTPHGRKAAGRMLSLSENLSADTDGGSRQGAALARALRATLAALLPFIYENIWKNVDKHIL